MILKRKFSISPRLRKYLSELVGFSLNSIYASQYISHMDNTGKRESYIGDKVIVSFYPVTDILILNQYNLCDEIFLSETNNINFEIVSNRLIVTEPKLMNRGFYCDFVGEDIVEIEIFAYYSIQAAEDEWAEISIADASGKTHYFIDIKCSYILRFLTKKSNLNLMLDNERYFQGGHEDFTSRFRILNNDESEKIINSTQYSVNGLNINYEKVFSTSD